MARGRNRSNSLRGQQFITEVVTLTSTVQVSKDDLELLEKESPLSPDDSFIFSLIEKIEENEHDFECKNCKTLNDYDAIFCKQCGTKRESETVKFDVSTFDWGTPGSFYVDECFNTKAFEEAMTFLTNLPGFSGEGTGLITYFAATSETSHSNSGVPNDRNVLGFILRPNSFEWRALGIVINP